mgnify:CR=1 FL=1
MTEFMLFIYQDATSVLELSPEEQQKHVQEVGAYLQKMMAEGKMLGAQPLERKGISLTQKNGQFHDGPFNESKEVIVGYYHLQAESLEEAIQIAKQDPRFGLGDWRIEIRPVMKVEGINK